MFKILKKETPLRILFNCVNYTVLFLLMFATLYPFWYVIMASVSDPVQLLMQKGFMIIPKGFSLTAYQLCLQYKSVWTGYLNTIIIVISGVTVSLTLSVLGGYFLSRKTMLRRPLSLYVVFTMFFGGGLIPKYITVTSLGMDNSFLALILPGAISTMNLLIMRNAFMDIPDSLEESAKIDGAGILRILWSIVLPLTKPMLAVMALFYAVGQWNAWFDASIYIKDSSKWPLQLVLRGILVQNSTTEMVLGLDMNNQSLVGETLKYAVTIVATIPILMVYPFLQKHFTKGMMVGAVKG